MQLLLILWVLVAHWIADFCFQTHWQATNKSINPDALFRHVSTYTATMMVALMPAFIRYTSGMPEAAMWLVYTAFFGIMTFVSHYITDAVTSRITGGLYKAHNGVSHDFFVVVGFDQIVHFTTLGASLYALGVIR